MPINSSAGSLNDEFADELGDEVIGPSDTNTSKYAEVRLLRPIALI